MDPNIAKLELELRERRGQLALQAIRITTLEENLAAERLRGHNTAVELARVGERSEATSNLLYKEQTKVRDLVSELEEVHVVVDTLLKVIARLLKEDKNGA